MQAKALYANTADTDEELSFKPGDVLTVHEQDVAGLAGWWLCSIGNRTGIAPGNRLQLLPETDKSGRLRAKPVSNVPSPDSSRPGSANKANKLIIPHKAGNVYVYDSPVSQDGDYDVPSRQQGTVMTSIPDYDIPQSSTTDYDVPVQQRDKLCRNAIHSNRSSITSVHSTGSQSSVASIRERTGMTSPGNADAHCIRSVRDSVLDDYDIPRGDATSDESTSADSGVYCGVQGSREVQRSTVTRTLFTPDCNEDHDYDVPEAFVVCNQSENERKHVDVTLCDRNDSHGKSCAVTNLKDNAMRNIERLVLWLNAEQSLQWSVQVKLAGLALKTSLQDLITLDDQSAQRSKSGEALRMSLIELSRSLDCFVASPSPGHPYSVSPGNRQHQQQHQRMTTSNIANDTVDSIRRLAFSLPGQVKLFADDVIAGKSTVIVDSVSPATDDRVPQSSPVTSDRLTATPPQSRSPSPRSTVCRNKPPPTKPKPPKRLVSAPNRHNNQEAQCNKTTTAGADQNGGWFDECDYAAIASEAERELGAHASQQNTVRSHVPSPAAASRPPRPPVSARPPIAKKAEPAASAPSVMRPSVNDVDRELIEFYAAQISAHTSIVHTASDEFFRCMSSPAVTPEVFVRRSRFVVLAGHKLVYLGDSLARHVTDEAVRDHVAVAANELCDQLKTVVMATKQAALAKPAEVTESLQSMVESIGQAAHGCQRLAGLINDISHW